MAERSGSRSAVDTPGQQRPTRARSFASSTLARISAASTTSEPPAVIASSGLTTLAKAGRLPRGGKVVARIRLGRGAPAPLGGGALTVGAGAVWAMSDVGPTLMRIDP